ncbi:DNA polymerase epsilon subunit 4, partial [Terrapene carolina triunguis]|uniref:DNA polymerase epsilon subunit 4 n=1 Tax=Terrapene triunguis TaxID=2587831 RepID=UPI000E77E386
MAAAADPGVGVAPPAEEPGSGSLCAAPLRLARLPLARVKALVKADPDVSLASQEAVFVLARATVRGVRGDCPGVGGAQIRRPLLRLPGSPGVLT